MQSQIRTRINHYLNTIPVVIILLLISACTQKNKNAPDLDLSELDQEAYKNYITAYTAGIISKGSVIYIKFASEIADYDQKPIAEVLDFTPKLKGKLSWEDASTLRFEPAEWLPTKKIKASLNLKSLFSDVPKELATFNFAFKAIDQQFDIEVGKLVIPNKDDLCDLTLSGTIFTADIAKADAVRQMLSVVQKGNKKTTISWVHNSDMLTHSFKVSNIRCNSGDQDGEIFLNWDGKSIGVDQRGVDTVNIPGQVFKIMKVVTQQEKDGDSYISIQFSQPVDQWQKVAEPHENNLMENTANFIKITRKDEEPVSNNDFSLIVEGNEIRCYAKSGVTGMFNLNVGSGLRSIVDDKLTGQTSFSDIEIEELRPAIRLTGKGVVIPEKDGLLFPFEAVSLNAVDLEIFKVYENNVIQFLQKNSLDHDNMRYVGRIIKQKRINLQALNPNARKNTWARYALNLDKLIEKEPGAIYQVRITFDKAYAACACAADNNLNMKQTVPQHRPDEHTQEYYSLFNKYGYYSYNYEMRNNPCSDDYYTRGKFIRQNVVASNWGIIAKRGKDKELFVAVTNLLTTEAVAGAEVRVYDRANQQIGLANTAADGTLRIRSKYTPHTLVVEHEGQKGYLSINSGTGLSMSRFKVGGSSRADHKGIRGKLYGERGVWRPGDSLFLTVVLESKYMKLPTNYPVELSLENPRGQTVYQYTEGKHLNGVYRFHLNTSTDAPTGTWRAKVKAGGLWFDQAILIETVQPNRLKIKMDLGKEVLLAKDRNFSANLKVNWLHGAVAKNLKTIVNAQLKQGNTLFKNYEAFEFDDPTRKNFSADKFTLFEGDLDEKGKQKINGKLQLEGAPAGKLRANFNIRVFEKGGNFSADNLSVGFSPYTAYAGIAIPKGDYGQKQLNIREKTALDFIVLDENGKALPNRKVRLGLYRLDWQWWWDNDGENLSRFNSSFHKAALQAVEQTTDSEGKLKWTVEPEEWGRYMVRICDEESGHCAGDFFYAGSPWDDSDFGGKQAASMLMFKSNKNVFETGEEVELTVPAGNTGRALVSLENGRGVLEHFWVDTKDAVEGVKTIKFKTTEAMSPTVYAHLTLIQPHSSTENDLPIRSYGVLPIRVENPESRLKPVIDMPNELQPAAVTTIKVKENSGKPMTYTIAMVDEGLLDLTRYKTPDLWSHFYQKEALGVETWDIYDYVLGAKAIQLDRIVSIGGGLAPAAAAAKKAERFKPMVRFLGPFELKKGATATHKIDIPNYIGSVRTMVVAVQDAAYGSAEKTTVVKKPLMTLATVPRVLSPREKIALPVTVFAMKNFVKEVKVEVKTNDLLQVKGTKTKNIKFSSIGDQVLYFDVEVAPSTGMATLEVLVSSGKEKASYKVEVDVRNPNPFLTKTESVILDPNKKWNIDATAIGMQGTNVGTLELSSLPPMNLSKRLKYLLRYPYGCIEQTTSAVFPQLYVKNLTPINKQKSKEIDRNIKAGIDQIKKFQTVTGGFSYWLGGEEASEWGSNYAGHFLLEARAKGYSVPTRLLEDWKNYQRALARVWKSNASTTNQHRRDGILMMQAYRLYTLALAKAPELTAMNLLLEEKDLPTAAKWRLAAAFSLAGNSTVAKRIIRNAVTEVKDYKELSYTYGSTLRDEAMILEALVLLQERKKAANLVLKLAKNLGQDKWYSTQTTAYALMAIAKFSGNNPENEKITYTCNIAGETADKGVLNKRPVVQYDLNLDQLSPQKIMVENTGNTILFGKLIIEGQPLQEDPTEISNNLKMKVRYEDLSGKALDPKVISQGTDFVAIVEVRNPGENGAYKELALHQVFPSGWEIINNRMNPVFNAREVKFANYQDIRDDRVYTFFDLPASKKVTYRVYLNAAYQGRFYMPNHACEAMYDHSIYANTAGGWVEVVADSGLPSSVQ